MSSLRDTQRSLAALLVGRSPIADDAAAEIARENGRLSPAEQVEIYRRQVWLRHAGCLSEDFAALERLLGESAWARLVSDYLEQYPPVSFELRHLGRDLPLFVASADWLPHHELCLDLCRLEQCYVEVFDASDVSPLRPEDVARTPAEAWPRARLVLNPALCLLEVSHPVAELRRRLRSGEELAVPEREPQQLVVYRRRDRELSHRLLESTPFALLSALAAGLPLGEACAHVAESRGAEAEIESRLGEWLQDWAARAFVVGLNY